MKGRKESPGKKAHAAMGQEPAVPGHRGQSLQRLPTRTRGPRKEGGAHLSPLPRLVLQAFLLHGRTTIRPKLSQFTSRKKGFPYRPGPAEYGHCLRRRREVQETDPGEEKQRHGREPHRQTENERKGGRGERASLRTAWRGGGLQDTVREFGILYCRLFHNICFLL